MEKLKVGLIGCGGIANQKHLPALVSQKDKCEMVAFCDIIPERAQKAAAGYGIEGAKVYEDYHDLLADPSIDVVHVLTPNVAHCPITVAAFEADKHVMCEKPMAATTEDAKLMMDAWKKSAGMPRPSTRPAGRALWGTSILPRPMPSAAGLCLPGACSRTSPSREAGPSLISAPTPWTSPCG